MEVRIVEFPETRVAVAEHRGPPQLEYETSKKLIEWRIQHRLSPANHRTYGVHYTDPQTVVPSEHRVDFCVTYDLPVEPNDHGIVSKIIPGNRCALARHLGSRQHNTAAVYLYREWLPSSGEFPGRFPMFLHYVNVGPAVLESDMITDVYLPLR
ncbi:AraC family transcriptional regulator [Povalibacter sp.]|uniref:AraC family transcriptional regulator n=1 Tax=Povalibacter sp. TaxID=1962978 RepID=UPI002F40E5A1